MLSEQIGVLPCDYGNERVRLLRSRCRPRSDEGEIDVAPEDIFSTCNTAVEPDGEGGRFSVVCPLTDGLGYRFSPLPLRVEQARKWCRERVVFSDSKDGASSSADLLDQPRRDEWCECAA
jgi:hypothetical protein